MSPAGRWFLLIMAVFIIIRRPDLVNQILNDLMQLFNSSGHG